MHRVVNSSNILVRGKSWRSRKLASFSNRLSQVLSIFISVESAIEIWNRRICCSMTSIISRLLTLVFLILIRRGRRLRLRVGRLVMLRRRWLRASVTMAWVVISGLVVLFCTRWLVDTCLLKTQTQINCIRKSWLVILLFLSSSRHKIKTWFKRFCRLIQVKGLRLAISETMIGIIRSVLLKWKESLLVVIVFLLSKNKWTTWEITSQAITLNKHVLLFKTINTIKWLRLITC